MTTNIESTEDIVQAKTPQQIERIKRQEEDEQWISGEELCTEGSSEDEEEITPSASKAPKAIINRQRKHKKLNHLLATKRVPRRPSPLAQEVLNISFVSSGSSSTKQSTNEDEECSDDETASRMIDDINSSYGEMLNRIQKLRQVLHEENKTTAKKCIDEELKVRKENVANVDKIFNDIRELDEQIAETEKKRAQEYKTRLQKQQELCSQIVIPEKYHPLAKNSESFLKLCQPDTEAFRKMQDAIDSQDKKFRKKEKPDNKNKPERPEPIPKTEAYFVSRNIKIAGERGINALPLSDEQKQRLFFLLRDIDENEENENFDFGNYDDSIDNAFKSRNENQQLKEINEKLDTFKSCVHRSEHLKTIVSQKSNFKIEECFKLKHIKNELSCIDRNLKTYKLKCKKQEFEPLPKEQMSNLIQSCASSLSLRSESSSVNEETFVFYDLPQNMIPNNLERKKLISQAKNCLPRFKFRFPEENESVNEEDENIHANCMVEDNITISN